jgi:O-antigen/teichoic acid export membrane protein
VFSFFGTARGKWLLTENLQIIGFYYLFFGGIVNIVLNLILIKNYGINGAASATIMSLFSIVIFFPLFHRKVRISVKMFFNIFNIVRVCK